MPFTCWNNVHRDDDDINDVASMAGVNLSEESANILATNSELVGVVTHSCKDEAFLSTSLLQRRMLEIGENPKTFICNGPSVHPCRLPVTLKDTGPVLFQAGSTV